jgi:hypothetical protein
MKRECTNTHISIQYHDNQVIKQLLHIKCHVLRFTKDEAQKMLQHIYLSFAIALSLMISTLSSPRREWACSNDLHLRVPEGNPILIGLDLPLTALVGVAKRNRKILTCTQINKNHKSKSLSDYAQQDLSVMIRRPRILDMQRLQVK